MILEDRLACRYAGRGVENKVIRQVRFAEYVKQQDGEAQSDNVRAAARQQWIGSSDLNQGDYSNAWQHFQEVQ